ncbi:MAG TPA: rhodanese-like domain-containing protein [bacterium]|nr:rhodanese-like domain-containing protein [bacterium]
MLKRVSADEAHAQLSQDPKACYLDVRSTQEYAAGHPAGAYNVPIMEPDPATGMMAPNPSFLATVEANFPDKDQPIFTGCKSGMRSQQAARALTEAGYTNVCDVKGGFHGQQNEVGMKVEPGWLDHELPVETEPLSGRDYTSLLGRLRTGT